MNNLIQCNSCMRIWNPEKLGLYCPDCDSDDYEEIEKLREDED